MLAHTHTSTCLASNNKTYLFSLTYLFGGLLVLRGCVETRVIVPAARCTPAALRTHTHIRAHKHTHTNTHIVGLEGVRKSELADLEIMMLRMGTSSPPPNITFQ